MSVPPPIQLPLNIKRGELTSQLERYRTHLLNLKADAKSILQEIELTKDMILSIERDLKLLSGGKRSTRKRSTRKRSTRKRSTRKRSTRK